jgi:hypothetical protein
MNLKGRRTLKKVLYSFQYWPSRSLNVAKPNS